MKNLDLYTIAVKSLGLVALIGFILMLLFVSNGMYHNTARF